MKVGKCRVGWLAVVQNVQSDECVKNSSAQYLDLRLRVYLSENSYLLIHCTQSHSQWALWRGKQRNPQLFCTWIKLKIPENITLRKVKIISWLFPSAFPSLEKQGPSRAIKVTLQFDSNNWFECGNPENSFCRWRLLYILSLKATPTLRDSNQRSLKKFVCTWMWLSQMYFLF